MSVAIHPVYESRKSTDVEWIGEVPAGWQILRVQDFSTVNDDVLVEHDYRNRQIRYVDISGVDATSNTYSFEVQDFNDAPSRARRMVKAGDTVFSTVRPYLKAVATISEPEKGLVFSTGFAVIRPRHNADSRFVGYVLRNDRFIDEVSAHSVGASYPAINTPDLVKLHVLLPPLSEQRAIAAFLDGKCTRIDEAVRIKEEQIKLLRERRKILIQQAVTRGLNPDAPMKDSGIDWIGQIPAHWDIQPLMTEAKPKSVANRSDLELLSVYLDRGVVRFSDVDEKRTNATSYDLSNYQHVLPGDLVLNNQQAWRGSVGVSSYEGIVSPAYIILALSDRWSSDFANLFFRSGPMVSQYLVSSKGVGTIQRNLYWPKLKRANIAIPPIEEQREIALQVQAQSERINAGIQTKENQIAALKEYKSILINAAVTGKIKVA